MSGSLVGGRVKEPKVRTYGRPLHVDMQSYQSSALSDAWSSYGKAKSTLNHLESQLNDEEEEGIRKGAPRRLTPSSTQASSYPVGSLASNMVTQTTVHRVSRESCSRRGKPRNEQFVEGSVLNETHQTGTSSAHTRNTQPHTSGRVDAHARNTQPHTSGRVDATTLLSSVYRGPSPYTRDPPLHSSPHSTPTPLFGPADFRERRLHNGTSPVPNGTNGIEGNQDMRPLTVTRKTRSSKGKTTATTHVTHSDTRQVENTVASGGKPKLNLPKETISDLLETVERQKIEFNEFKKRNQERKTARPDTSTHISGRMPTSYQQSYGKPPSSSDLPGPIKRRKVATAPPPKTYAGFTSIVQGPPSLTSKPLSSFSSPIPKPDPETRQPAPKPPPPKITPYSWRSGQDVVNKLLGKDDQLLSASGTKRPRLPTAARGHLLTKLSNKNASELLQDLEDEEEEEVEEELEGDEEEREETTRRPGLAAKLRKVLHAESDIFDTPPKVVERHYDRESVRRYMKGKEEEKRRKIREEKEAQLRAQQERERRLKELQNRQRQILTSNLIKQKRQMEELERGDPPLPSYSKEVYTSFSAPRPSSVPVSYSCPPVTSPFYHTQNVSPPHSELHTSPISAHSFSSPTTVPVSLSFTTTPTPLSVGPRVNLTFNTPPPSQHQPHSHSPIPVPVSTSHLSPYLGSAATQSFGLSTFSQNASVTPPCSPIRPPSASPKSSLGSPRRTPVSDHQQARILALKQSAIALREKIAAQKRVMTSRRMYTPTKGTPEVSILPTENLPGISSIYQHTAHVQAQLRREQAATKIQSLWKGYKARKNNAKQVKPVASTSLASPRPNFQATPIIQVTPPNPLQVRPVTGSPIPITASHHSSSIATPTTTTATPVQTSPWLKGGGDHYSVINIYTRRQEQLKKMLEEQPLPTSVLTTERPLTMSTTNQESYTLEYDSQSHTDSVSGQEEVEEEEERINEEEGDEVDMEEEKQEEDEEEEEEESHHYISSAITPPGSPSFHQSFTMSPIQPPVSVPPPKAPSSDSQRWYSPHSLEVKLRAELNKLEAVEEGVRQLEGVESTRAVSLAQQETVALAQILKSQTKSHQDQVQSVTDKAKQDTENAQRELQKLTDEATKMSERLRRLEEQSRLEKERHQQEMQQVQTISSQKVEEVTQQLLDSQSTMTSAILVATEKQLQSTQDMAEGVAKAAAQGAVLAALKKPQSSTTPNISYRSDFEEPPSLLPTNSLTATLTPTNGLSASSPITISVPTATFTENQAKLSPQLSGGSNRSQSLTPVPSEKSSGREEEEGEKTITEMDSEQEEGGEEEKRYEESSLTEEVSEEISDFVGEEVREEEEEEEGEVSELSFRELVPSESHRRRQMKRMKPSYRDTHDPSLQPNHSGEGSPISVTGEESFSDFMSRMLQQYVKEEEMRSKHQAALLELREKAIKEKTDAQLKWLKIRKRQVQKHGDDLAIPPLLKREKGLIKKLQHQQAEIERLREAHKAASHERKLLLLQQQDISRLHRSAHYYRDKIRRYGVQNSREQSPFTDHSLSPSPSPSISLSQEDIREQLSSFSSSINGSPIKTLSQSTTSLPDMVNQSMETTPISLIHQTVPVLKSTPTSDQDSMKLRQKSSQEAERLLNKRTEQLKKRRKKAEELLRAEQDILRRKKELDAEEERIAVILEQAKECRKQIEGEREPPSLSALGTPVSPIDTTKMSSTVSEEVLVSGTKSSEIPEEISEIAHSSNVLEEVATSRRSVRDYETSTFESINSDSLGATVITSTPEHSSKSHDEADLQIEELKRQLREKELELERQKHKMDILSRGSELLKKNKQEYTHSESLTTSVLSTEQTTPTKSKDSTLGEEPVRTATPDHTKDGEVLSPISSGTSSTSASTVVSVEGLNKEKGTENRESPPIDEEPSNEKEEERKEEEIPGDKDRKVAENIQDKSDEFEEAIKKPVEESTVLEDDRETKSPIQSEGVGEEHSEEDIEEEVESGGEESGSVKAFSPLQLSPRDTSPEPKEEELPGDHVQEEPQSGLKSSPTPPKEPAAVSPAQASKASVTPENNTSSPPEVPDNISIGARVLVGSKVEGTVQYIGKTEFAKGLWIGVELDYQKGINDGSVDGKRYFTCSPKYGVFAPPSKVVPLKTDPVYSESEEESEEKIEEEVEEDDEEKGEGEEPPAMEIKLPEEDEHPLKEEEGREGGDTSHDSESVLTEDESANILEHSAESPKHILAVSKDLEIPVNGITDGLLQQLTAEAFNTVHGLWKEKVRTSGEEKDQEENQVEKENEETEEKEEKTADKKATRTRDQLVDGITDDLLKVLVASEVSVMCNIRSAKYPTPEETKVKTDASPLKRSKSTSFSSEPLSLVPSSREAVNCITHYAWNVVMNGGNSHEHDTEIPPELMKALCTMPPGPMLACQESFVKFVHQLAIETIAEHKEQHVCCSRQSLASRFSPRPLSLHHVQTDVYMIVNQCKQSVKLPPVRYLHGNCRPGGKAIDSVDMLLIKELREEEASWVSYDQDEKDVKMRTADEILDLLLDETVEVLNCIYSKRKTP